MNKMEFDVFLVGKETKIINATNHYL